jgi:hypothetical protein
MQRTHRRLAVRAALVAGVLLLPAAFPVAAATFTGATSTDGSTVSAADLAPPSGLAVTQTCPPGPGIAFRSRATAIGMDTVTVALPPGTAADDLLIAQVAFRTSPRTVTAPSGWTLLRSDQAVDGGVTSNAASSALFWKRATAAEPASATFSLSAGVIVPVAGVVAAYSGVHRTTPLGPSAAAVGYGATASTPSVTTTLAGAWVVHVLTKRQETLPAPTGTTARWGLPSATSGNAWVGATGADEVRAVPGATGSRTSSLSTFTSEWVSQAVVLRPAFGNPSAALSWTASTSSGAGGYQLERLVGGTVQTATTVTPVSATSTSSGPLVDGTAYTFRLRTYYGTWTSPDVTVGLTPSC